MRVQRPPHPRRAYVDVPSIAVDCVGVFKVLVCAASWLPHDYPAIVAALHYLMPVRCLVVQN